MSRKPRLHETGDIHHVMSHGIDTLNLFETNEDCKKFIEILETNFLKFDCHCYAFTFLKNHYHLLIRPSGDNFSKMMRNINNTFARYINKTRKRRGYVFFDRFKSIPTRDLNYVKNLILYIHTNPIRSKKHKVSSLKELDSYLWSSHYALKQKISPYSWLKSDYTLALFNKDGESTYKNYRKEMQNYLTESPDKFKAWEVETDYKRPEPKIPAEVFKNEANWVRSKIKAAEKIRIFREKVARKPGIVQQLLDESCKKFSLSRESFEQNMRKHTKKICNVIKLFSYWSIELAGFSGVFVGNILHRSNSAVLRSAMLGSTIGVKAPFPIKV